VDHLRVPNFMDRYMSILANIILAPQKLDIDKHSSLFCSSIIGEAERFHNIVILR
jgi:hypothetical protein